jgi:hypothetical protein
MGSDRRRVGRWTAAHRRPPRFRFAALLRQEDEGRTKGGLGQRCTKHTSGFTLTLPRRHNSNQWEEIGTIFPEALLEIDQIFLVKILSKTVKVKLPHKRLVRALQAVINTALLNVHCTFK